MPFDNTPLADTSPAETQTAFDLIMDHAIKLLSNRQRWTKCKAFEYLPGGGVAYCAVGAVRHASTQLMLVPPRDVHVYLNTIAMEHGYESIVALNDDRGTTHEFILSILREVQTRFKGV